MRAGLGEVCWAALCLTAACASGIMNTPVYSKRARAVAGSQPTEGPRIEASACVAAAACEADCSRGDVNACTRLADLAFDVDADRAERLWIAACENSDGRACARLQEIATHDLELADQFGHHACVHRETMACDYLGESQLVRARAPTSREDASALFRAALRSFERSCEMGSWGGCDRAADVLAEHRGEATSGRQEQHRRRARDLAESACQHRDPDACEFIGSAVPPAPATEPGRGSATRTTILARWISGKTKLRPPKLASRWMKANGIAKISAKLRYCVSPIGRVSLVRMVGSSPTPSWDRTLFEAVRGWRYRPRVVDGKSVGFCTSSYFHGWQL